MLAGDPSPELPEPEFDPSNYPRSYRPTPFWRGLQRLASLALLVAAPALLVAAAFVLPVAPTLTGWLIVVSLSVMLFVLGVAGWIDLRRALVVLHADAIEVHGLRGTRRVLFEQLVGRRGGMQAINESGAAHLLVAPQAGHVVRLPLGLRTDDAFDAWMLRIPDVDAAQRQASLEAMSANPALGASPELRLQRLQTVGGVSQLATWGAVGVMAWAVVADQIPIPVLVALAAMPWMILAVIAVSKGILRLAGSPHDVRPDLLGLFVVACAPLVLRLLIEANLEDATRVIPAALFVGVVFSVWPLRMASRPVGRARPWMLVPVLCLYSGALLTWVNALADRAPVQPAQTVATFKAWNNQRAMSFSLRLDPWGSLKEAQYLKVNRAMFNSVSPGETVCVHEHGGALGWRWKEVSLCPQATTVRGPQGMPSALYRSLKLVAHEPGRRGPWLRLLADRRYTELDQQLNELQSQFERGERSSDALLKAYRDFYDPDPDLDVLFDAWVAHSPRSYAAHLARGIHRKFQAEALGAAGFEKVVSPDVNVEVFLDRQIHDLEQSTRLTPRPTLSYAHLLDAAMHRRQQEQMDAWLERGLLVEPGSLVLTRKYLAMQRPMYGGSLKRMEDFVARCHRDKMPIETLNTLDAMLYTQQGWVKSEQGQEDAALALFRQASALQPFHEDMSTALTEEARVLKRRGQADEAALLLERAVLANPRNARARALLGSALQANGRVAEAVVAYTQAAEDGDRWAQAHLGERYLQGNGVERDEAKARLWLNRAASRGSKEAKQTLLAHPDLRTP